MAHYYPVLLARAISRLATNSNSSPVKRTAEKRNGRITGLLIGGKRVAMMQGSLKIY